MAIGRPGWPEFAAWTASMDSVRMVSMLRRSMSEEAMPRSIARRPPPNGYRSGPEPAAALAAHGREVARLAVDDVVDVALQPVVDVVGLRLRELLVAHRRVEVGLLRGEDRLLEAVEVLALRLGDVGQRLAVLELVAQGALAQPQVLGGGVEVVRAEQPGDARTARP